MSHDWTSRSGNDVGDNPVGNLLDFILQGQLSLLHPGQLKLVAIARNSQQFDFSVEAAMLGFQKRQHLLRIVVVHPFALQEARIAVTRPTVIGKPLDPSAEPMRIPSDKCLVS
jgi:hypothetical protein